MLDLVTHANGLATLRSPLLAAAGVRHGFSTRVGGLSRGPYASLNLGSLRKNARPGEGDHNTSVSENFRRLRAALRLERRPRFAAVQCHGAQVWEVDRDKPPREADVPSADGLVTAVAGPMLTVRTADCVPVLLATADGRAVGAVHAGWRGVLAGVVEASVGAVRRVAGGVAGATGEVAGMGGATQPGAALPVGLVAAVGPCIGVDRFEVGEEVAEAFDAAGLGACVRRGEPGWGERPHVDLAEAVVRRLIAAGVAAGSIDRPAAGGPGACTYVEADLFFSYRRDVTHGGAARTGHMAAVISIDP
ncbi:MAG: polyphenol oxidase family protein [Planctomycetota bacterium]